MANGALRVSLAPGLVYDSALEANIGFGKGIMLEALVTAQVLTSANGSRVIIQKGGRTSAMIPIEGYNGPFAYWPAPTPVSARKDGSVITVTRAGGTQTDTFEEASPSDGIFFLTSTVTAFRTTTYRYGANGIESISSNNDCDGKSEFFYENGKLVRIEQLGPIKGTSVTLSYDSSGRVSGFVSSGINTPKIGELPTSVTRSFKWYPDGRLDQISDESGKLISRWIYADGRVSQFIQPKVTQAFAYGNGATTVRSSNTKLPSTYWIQNCQVASSLTGPSAGPTQQYDVTPSDVDQLDIIRLRRTVNLDKSETVYTYLASGLLDRSEVFSSTGEKIYSDSLQYSPDNQVLVKRHTHSGGSWDQKMSYQNGLLVQQEGPDGKQSYEYSSPGIVSRVFGPAVDSSYVYDANGLLLQRADTRKSLEENYTYTPQCQLASVTTPYGSERRIYFPDGRLARKIQTGLQTVDTEYSFEDDKGYQKIVSKTGERTTEVEYDYWGNLLTTAINGQANYDYKENL